MEIAGFPVLDADEVATLIPNGAMVAFSGFTPAGEAKVVPQAIARHASELHSAGLPYQIRVITGASTGARFDEALAQAEAISWRAPYQSSATLRAQINRGEVDFVDMHLSHVPQSVLSGFFGKIDFAVIEASDITPDGRLYLTTSVGASPTFLQTAENIVIELNRSQSRQIGDMADIVVPKPPPFRAAIDLDHPLQRIGKPYFRVDPERVIAIVETDEPDQSTAFTAADETSKAIANHVVEYLANELAGGRIPPGFLPLQSGVGNVGNAVLEGIGENTDIPNFTMFTEVLQASALDLLVSGRLTGASTSALVLSPKQMKQFSEDTEYFASRMVMRPQEISNNPAAIRQLGIIAINTALEFDIYGHVNSTHVCGQQIMNGIGGSGDFARNAYQSIFMCPSTAKGGTISTVVPMCTHVDHNEHSVQVLVTEQGYADLRGLAPDQRAKRIIDNCAHPNYRDYLHRYVRESRAGHIRHNLHRCFELHCNLMEYGSMLPDRKVTEANVAPPIQMPVSMPTTLPTS